MIFMNKIEKIKAVLERNQGYITTDDFLKLNICKPMIKKYIEIGLVRKVHHGLFIDNTLLEDDYFILQKMYPSVVFSHMTALYLWKLTTDFPVDIDLTVVKDKKVRGDYKVHHVDSKYYDLGIVSFKSPFDNPIRLYNMERCLCDLFRMKMDSEKREKIVRHYLNRKDKDIERLMEYSKVFHLDKIMSKVIEK